MEQPIGMRHTATRGTRASSFGQKPPLKLKDIWAIRVRLQLSDRSRDLALFNLAIYHCLCGLTPSEHRQ